MVKMFGHSAISCKYKILRFFGGNIDNMPKNDISKTKNTDTSVRTRRDFEIAKVTKILEFRDLDDK